MTHKSITEDTKRKGRSKITPQTYSGACPLIGSSQLKLGPTNEALDMHIGSGLCRVRMKIYLHEVEIRRKSVTIP